VLRAVLLPFLWTRLALALVAWLGTQVSPGWSYPDPDGVRRGFAFVRWIALDAFGRWDAHWYLDLARHGYALRGPLGTVQSNVAFFPLYPWLVRGVDAVLPGAAGDGRALLAALLVSNAAVLVGLSVLWRLSRAVTGDAEAASRTVLYALAFPFGFVLSAAYPESLFLLLGAGSMLAALRGRWAIAGALGLLAALTRPHGVLVAVPLGWIALFPPVLPGSGAGAPGGLANGPRRRAGLAAAALPLAGLALHALHLARVTGDPLALFHAQAAWARGLSAPWTTLLHPRDLHPFLGPLEAASLALVAATGAWLLRQSATRPLGLLALASLVPVLLSGTLVSSTRFAAATFPAFVALGMLGRRAWVDRALLLLLTPLQAALFLLWSRFFWVG
jgi:hypothetical protein